MKTLRDLYKTNIELNKTNKYDSINYQMTRFDNEHKELEKTHYIKENKEKLKRIREILSKKIITSGSVPHREDFNNYKNYFNDYIEYDKAEKDSLFYGCWVWLSIKRELELQTYLDIIIEKADKLLKTNDNEAINYLIDEKYKYHRDILDVPKDDFVYRDELNQIIFDYLQSKINEITSIEPLQPLQPIRHNKKPLHWNAKKQSLGTLFGLLVKHNIITGNKIDIERVLGGIFDNISQSSIKDNLNFKTNENEAKGYYCTETPDLLTDWIAFLENSTTKQK